MTGAGREERGLRKRVRRLALAALPVKGRAPKTGYDHEQFGDDWLSVDGCDTKFGSGRRRYYENCDAVRAAGVAPLTRGDGIYEHNTHMDRDGDGVACE